MRLTTALLLLPLTISAQVTLTPMEVRRANVLLDHRDRLIDQRKVDSLQLIHWQTAYVRSEALRLNREKALDESTALVKLGRDREGELETALSNASKVAKRRERLAYVLAGVAAAEAVVIGIAYGLKD
jgi:hypothetical protein